MYSAITLEVEITPSASQLAHMAAAGKALAYLRAQQAARAAGYPTATVDGQGTLRAPGATYNQVYACMLAVRAAGYTVSWCQHTVTATVLA